MKKLFSLVALAGMFMLMSFGSYSVSSNSNEIVEIATVEIAKEDGEGVSRRRDCKGLARMIGDYYGLDRGERRKVYKNCMRN